MTRTQSSGYRKLSGQFTNVDLESSTVYQDLLVLYLPRGEMLIIYILTSLLQQTDETTTPRTLWYRRRVQSHI